MVSLRSFGLTAVAAVADVAAVCADPRFQDLVDRMSRRIGE